MKSIVIAGGGGFGYEVAEYIRQDISHGLLRDAELNGVIDDEEDASCRSPLPLPYLGTITSYKPGPKDFVVLAIGQPSKKRNVVKQLRSVGCSFMTYVHSSVYVSMSAKIGEGVVICPFSVVNSGAVLENFVTINLYCSIAHGAVVGQFSVLSPYSALNGDSSIGDECILGTRATVFPRTKTGNHCIVDSHSYVKFSTSDNSIITNRGKYTVIKNRLIK
ncbi:acetyltransferase [Chlorobaculum limnaeum]|uniref:acetyltransferase n=1 Tax=Chlorobaculum limnaeum TaxID=274537 RepID=UPI0012EE86E1|nr:acetyltransferase [Chlorobaculum limnaeum]